MDELLGIFPKEGEGNFQSQKFGRPEWEIGDRFLFVHLPPVLLSRNLMYHQLWTFRHHHHLDCPSKIVLGDHRAFWVACRSRCVDQHASLVHSLLPGRTEPSLEKTSDPTLLENLRLCSNRWSSSFRPMRISSSQERTPGSVTFQSDLWKAVAIIGPQGSFEK